MMREKKKPILFEGGTTVVYSTITTINLLLYHNEHCIHLP
jgi:hypothetical protein